MTYIFSHTLPQSVPDTPGMPNHTQPRLYRLLVWIIHEVHECSWDYHYSYGPSLFQNFIKSLTGMILPLESEFFLDFEP